MIICIVGPTGVGKTRLSEHLAKKYDAIVVNADAMQIYKELNIGTAKIKTNEMLASEHYLFDIKRPDEDYSAYDYQRDLRNILDKNKNRNIIIVGGTGLYIKAGLFNYEFSEREKVPFDEYTNEELYRMLESRNDLNEIHINNRKRMISRLNSSGNNNLKNELLYDTIFIGLTTPRDVLYENINDRVDKMMDEGLLHEVKKLYSKYGRVKSLATGIGYKEIIEYLDGNISYDEAVELIKTRSRKYAKRQYTWFNNQMDIKWFNTDYEDFNKTIKIIENYIDSLN